MEKQKVSKYRLSSVEFPSSEYIFHVLDDRNCILESTSNCSTHIYEYDDLDEARDIFIGLTRIGYTWTKLE